MGGVLSAAFGAADLLSFGQQYHSLRRQEKWSKREYDISLQSMRIDILNTVREEMRDQVSVIVSSLDNLMVVATLTLSIGFGFVVEGTFPPPEDEHHYSSVEEHFLVMYAVLCALSLVFPLACLMLTIAARFEVELCQQDVMDDLKWHLLRAITQDRAAEALAEERERQAAEGGSAPSSPPRISRSASASALSPSPFHSRPSRLSLAASPASGGGRPALAASSPGWRPTGAASPPSQPSLRRERSVTWDVPTGPLTEHGPADATPRGRGEGVAAELSRGLSGRFRSLFEEDRVLQVLETDVLEVAEGLQQRAIHWKWLYSVAQVFLWLGLVSCVITCSVLLGLFFRANYPETHWVWRCYSGILLIAAVSSIVFLIWMRRVMLAEPIRRRRGAGGAPAPADAASPTASPTEGARAEPPAAPPEPVPLSGLGPLAAPLLARHRSDPAAPAASGALRTAPTRGRSAPLLGLSAAGALAAARHEHELVLTLPSDHFSAAWRCDGCGTKFSVLASCQRYRCAQRCDFDLCGDCYRSVARGAPRDTPSSAAGAGRGLAVLPQGALVVRENVGASAGLTALTPFVVRERASDGNCLFRSFSDQLYGTPEHHGLVRDRCSKYIASEQERFQQLSAGPFDELLARVRRDGEWGDVLEIEALSEIYDRHVEIYAPGSHELVRTIRRECRSASREPVRLQYEGLSHYSSLARRGQTPFVPLLGAPGQLRSQPGEVEDDAITCSRQRREAARGGHRAHQAEEADHAGRDAEAGTGAADALLRGLVDQSGQLLQRVCEVLQRVCEVQALAVGAERRLEELAASVGEVREAAARARGLEEACAREVAWARAAARGAGGREPARSPSGFREKLHGLAAEYDRLLAQQPGPPLGERQDEACPAALATETTTCPSAAGAAPASFSSTAAPASFSSTAPASGAGAPA